MNRNKRILTHICFWLIFHTIGFYNHNWPWHGENGGDVIFWFSSILSKVNDLIQFYWYYAFLIPVFLLQKKYWQFTLLYIASIIVICFIDLATWNLSYSLNFEFHYETHQLSGLYYMSTFSPMFALAVLVIENWVDSEIKMNQLEKLNTESKTHFLKSQINPHFMFNTLNNIYALSLTDQHKTKIALEKLETNFQHLTQIEKSDSISSTDFERYIKDYIALCKMRIVQADQVQVETSIEDKDSYVYPMLFIPFIENAFKHACLKKEDSYIKIHFSSSKDHLRLTVKNSIAKTVVQKDGQHGIGTQNVKERLELLYKPEEYRFDIIEDTDYYETILEVPHAK